MHIKRYDHPKGQYCLEIKELKPNLTNEMQNWLNEYNIQYKWFREFYGPATFHYRGFIIFENEEDMIFFKLRFQ